MKNKVYQEIASRFNARTNCEKRNNTEWHSKHEDAIDLLCKNFLPSGSGVNCGTKFDYDTSKDDKLVFIASYHHMNESGYYDGWTEHKITVTPSLQSSINLTISGRNCNDIKDYLHEIFHHDLTQDIESYLEDGELKYRNPKKDTTKLDSLVH